MLADINTKLSAYNYELPEERIALYPSAERGESKLLVLKRATGELVHTTFNTIFDFFPSPVLFVVNNSKVLPARLCGARETGAVVEFLLLTPLPLLQPRASEEGYFCEAIGLLKGGKRCAIQETLIFGELRITIEEKLEFGKCRVILAWKAGQTLEQIFQKQGHIPLPPYIKREDSSFDAERYQTIFANEEKCGSVASPTANLHCSEVFLEKMKAHGSSIASITLYVGYGTFSPIRTEDIRDHIMHEEYIEIAKEDARRIQEAKEQGIPIVAIGTTAMRAVESVASRYGDIQPCAMMTDIYITPGYTFKYINHLITNFHLPESSLLVLVSAFATREQILVAYQEAIEQKYMFFSYGDATLLL